MFKLVVGLVVGPVVNEIHNLIDPNSRQKTNILFFRAQSCSNFESSSTLHAYFGIKFLTFDLQTSYHLLLELKGGLSGY